MLSLKSFYDIRITNNSMGVPVLASCWECAGKPDATQYNHHGWAMKGSTDREIRTLLLGFMEKNAVTAVNSLVFNF